MVVGRGRRGGVGELRPGGCGVLVYFGSGGVGIGGNRMLTCNVERECVDVVVDV